jgi:hypothetical protein
VVYLLLVLAQSVALHELIRRYVSGMGKPWLNLNRSIEWWRDWLPAPMTVWLAGSLGFAALALLLFAVQHRPAMKPVDLSANPEEVEG